MSARDGAVARSRRVAGPAAFAAGLALATLAGTTRAGACDLAEFQAAREEVCEAALAEPAAILEVVQTRLGTAEGAEVARRLAMARELCRGDDPLLGAREAARLARLAGRLEARLGLAEPIWPDRVEEPTR